MNKSDLVTALHKELDIPIRKTEEIVDTMFQHMSRTLVNGNRIEIYNGPHKLDRGLRLRSLPWRCRTPGG